MKITSHSQGAPCWVDLATTDQVAAKAFYADLFGWDCQDNPMDEAGNVFYTMAMVDGAFVGGMYEQPQDQREAGIPPHWMIHLAVDDVDAIAARVPELGGTVGAPPFDVFEAGRMSIISDPAGAHVAFWQAKGHIGTGVKSEPNTIHWCELLTQDPDTATAFYAELLGMESETLTMAEEGAYTILLSGGVGASGIMAMPVHLRERGVPAHWSVYFQIEDVEAAVAHVTAAGGRVALPPKDIPMVGRIAYLLDPQGAGFGLTQPE
ncbi:MAG: VOC family protein [Chloroflexi bacterium]|nr:VOC family protein [Chloroflexota bacterium]